jgi:hypothetical protein
MRGRKRLRGDLAWAASQSLSAPGNDRGETMLGVAMAVVVQARPIPVAM